MPLFTILIPTHDHADTLFYSVASAQRQTVQDFEILVVGDGAPPRTGEVMAEIMAGDSRVRYLPFAKGERHGERNRHEALKMAAGTHVAYLADDDMWAPEHLETLLPALESHDLVHTMHVRIFPDGHFDSRIFDARLRYDLERMRVSYGGFGFANGAHTLAAYRKLPFGWRPAPAGFATDLYFWLQFLDQPWCRYAPVTHPTLFHFASKLRVGYTVAQRVAELAEWTAKLRDRAFRDSVSLVMWQQIALVEHRTLCESSPAGSVPVAS